MEVINTVRNTSYSTESSVTIGAFDTIHRGHSFLIEKIKDNLPKNNKLVVITFIPNPKYVLGKDEFYKSKILSVYRKRNILRDLGVDILCEINFNKEFSKITAKSFLFNYIIVPFSPNKIFVGHDLHFGYKREGDLKFLKLDEGEYGYKTICVSPMLMNDKVISTFNIRNDIIAGKVDDAFDKLGFYYDINGEVKKGDGLGTKISFPTANIDISANDMLLPRNGVYLVKVHLPDKQSQYGMANIGYKPTVSDKNTISLEVHIFNFKKPLYQCKLRISFVRYIRNEIKFESVTALREQIVRDEVRCKEIMN